MSLGALGALEAAGRGRAIDKVPQTEIVVSIDGSPPEVEKLLDPNSSLMSTVMVTPKANAEKIVTMLVGVLRGEIGPMDPYVAQAGGLVLHPDCDEVNAALRDQFYQEEDVPCP
jgi:ABC-type sugar transport system substrate-binding protein